MCGIRVPVSDAFGWGAVTRPRCGAGLLLPHGGAAVRGPMVGNRPRPAGGVPARGPYGGAAYPNGASSTAIANSHNFYRDCPFNSREPAAVTRIRL